MIVKRVIATEAAQDLVKILRARYGPLMFHQSGGCCDGSSPMCFEKDEFITGSSDICIGEVFGCPFYISIDQFEYWKHTQIILDVSKGRGSSFSNSDRFTK